MREVSLESLYQDDDLILITETSLNKLITGLRGFSMLGVIVDKTKRRAMVILKNFRYRWGQCTFYPFYLEIGTDLNDVFETNIRILQFLKKLFTISA